MKTTFLVRDGLTQVVLHPETKLERTLLDMLQGDHAIAVHRAQFAETQGGYVRDFSRRSFGAFDSPDHLPDTVLVLRSAEPPKTVETVPEGIDLYKRTDGTWFYRNHAGTWQHCPPPFSEGRTVPPPPESAVMDVDLCRFRDGSWVRYKASEMPGVGSWVTCPPPDQTYEVEQLRAELRTIRDQYVENRGDMHADDALRAISRVVTNALGDRS